MKQLTPKTEKDINELLARIKRKTKLTQEEIAKKIGYNRSYISQAKKTDSEKLYNALLNAFKEELENITFANEPGIQSGKDKIIADLSESIRKLTDNNTQVIDNNTKMVNAILEKMAILDSMKLSLEKKLPESMNLLTSLIVEGQKKAAGKILKEFEGLKNRIPVVQTSGSKKTLQNQKRSGTG